MTATSLSKEELLALDGKGLEAILIQISAQLLTRGWMLATAESCTGGMIAAACTDLAGSSQWFERGFVTYSNAAKTELLGVPAGLIATHHASFNFWAWARQALGTPGLLLGWSPSLRSKVRKTADANLRKFLAR